MGKEELLGAAFKPHADEFSGAKYARDGAAGN
jgi:hypothetical protein